MKNKNLLLHTCCAPCMGYVYELLRENYSVTSFFYNPNIMPLNEYRIRFLELDSYSKIRSFPLMTENPDTKKWVEYINNYRYMGEGSERCWRCYEFRLDQTFRKAYDFGFDFVATTLSISPHKNASKINEIGEKLSEKYNIAFHFADFKKNNGVSKSIEISKKK